MTIKKRLQRWLGLSDVASALAEAEEDINELRRQIAVLKSVQNRKERRAVGRATLNPRSPFFKGVIE